MWYSPLMLPLAYLFSHSPIFPITLLLWHLIIFSMYFSTNCWATSSLFFFILLMKGGELVEWIFVAFCVCFEIPWWKLLPPTYWFSSPLMRLLAVILPLLPYYYLDSYQWGGFFVRGLVNSGIIFNPIGVVSICGLKPCEHSFVARSRKTRYYYGM